MIAGHVGKPHGIHGEVYVERISDDPRRFEPGARLLHEDGRILEVEDARVHRTRFLVRFRGVTDRAVAEDLRGKLFVRRNDLRALEADEYWEHDLIGCVVVDTSGALRGRVARVDPGSAHDLLVVETDAGDRLVPVVKQIVRSVDMASGRIVVDPPEGLLD